jgi:hypothetical protein
MNLNPETPFGETAGLRRDPQDGETPREKARVPGDRRRSPVIDRRGIGPTDRRGRGLDLYRFERPQ